MEALNSSSLIKKMMQHSTLCKAYTLVALLLSAIGVTQAQTLVWEENFNATTINPSTWTFDFGNGSERDAGWGWGNSELEYYTSRTDNARIESGSLVIEAKREAFQGSAFTSARLKTEGRMHFRYGTVEARIKLPNMANGLWPAFWTLGTIGGNWPTIGEIDMMEAGNGSAIAAGIVNRQITSAAHWGNATGAHEYTSSSSTSAVDLSLDYHLYKMVWTPQYIKMYLDNVEFYSLDISNPSDPKYGEFHQPHFLLLNVAVGGAYTGILNQANITAPLPGKMYVDYVKLYQNAGDVLDLDVNTALTGNFGVSTDNTPVAAALTFGTDAELFYWNNLTNIPNAVPYEGANVWAVRANAGNWFGMGVQNNYKNLRNFATGSLRFRFKSTYQGQFKIGIKTGHGESWVNFPANTTPFGLLRNGTWSEVVIPLSNFQNPSTGNNIDLNSVKNAFMFAGDNATSNADFYFDDVYYSSQTVVVNAAPSVSITSPTNNSTFAPNASITINATAADADGTVSQVDFYNGTTLIGTDNSSPYSYTWPSVPVGNYVLTAKATDNSGAMTTSSAVNVNVIGQSTEGYCGTVANGDYSYKVATVGTTVTFTFHPLTPIAGCNLALIYIREGAGGYAGAAMTAVGPDFIYTKTIANNTPLSIYFTYSTPPAGERNSSATPHSYTVGANCTGGTPPTVSLTSPTNNTTYTEPVALINITATANDADGTISKVEFYNGTTLLATKTSAPYSLDLTNVAAGNYFISAKATDNDGLFTLSSIVKVIVNPDNSTGFCGTLANGDYSYKAETVGGNVTFTFHPLSAIQGCNLSIIYIKEGNGGYSGNNMTAVGEDFKYTRAIANGTPLSIYFTYNTPPVGERNSAATPHSYTVGTNCLVVPVGNSNITAAPTPTRAAANVISLFSNAYTNRPVDTWSASWDQADVSDTLISGNATKIYTNLNYCGIEYTSNVINANAMTHFHIDIWTPNSTVFKVKLVDFGANGIYQGAPNDDTEHELSFTPTLNGWVSYDLPLSNFTGMTARAHLAQLILVGSNSKVYVDNVYFYNNVVPVELISFQAKAVNNTSVLTWHTASERNNQAFEIERSTDGTTFTNIGTVKGNGTTSTPHNYTFTDIAPSNGVNYYRLRQIDTDGKAALSKVVTVILGKNGWVLHNTLVHDVLNITVSDASEGPLSIFNISGQLMASKMVEGTQQWDVSSLAAGVYIVRNATGEARRFVKD
jgi:beta-glucanase (GH16 family)